MRLLFQLGVAFALLGCTGSSDNPNVTYPSGLRIDGLVQDPSLTDSYPDATSNLFPFDSGKQEYYSALVYFIDIASLSSTTRDKNISQNFTLNEYVSLPEGNGDRLAYFEPEITGHVQDLRSTWGAPLSLNSTFRSPGYNDNIGGSTYSRHMYGDAVDIGANDQNMAMDLYNLAKSLDVDYLEPASLTIEGKSSPWVHIDDRGFKP